jgi:hypothetical protein
MKKLKISKTFSLANRIMSEPHWHFTKDQVIETDNAYLIKRLGELKVAKEVDEKREEKVKEKEPISDKKKIKEKMKEGHLNKKMEAPINKGYFLDKKGRLVKDD